MYKKLNNDFKMFKFRFCIFDIKFNNLNMFKMFGYSEIRYNINLK